MATQSSRETATDEEDSAENPEPACTTTLLRAGEWETRPAAVYPPGYVKLCGACFGAFVPDDAWDDSRAEGFDHSELTDTLVRSTGAGSSRCYHLPSGCGHDEEVRAYEQ